MKVKNIAGKRFGKLTVENYHTHLNGKCKWLCKCDCGNEKFVATDDLNRGRVRSCGCLLKESAFKTHGDSGSRLYSIWKNMKCRCTAKGGVNYSTYVSKGITVCDEWKESYICFKKWALDNGYADDLSIDRIDGTKGYYPENCRWATKIEQANNTSTNRLITYKGKTQSISLWAKELGVSRDMIYKRLSRGWTIDDIFI